MARKKHQPSHSSLEDDSTPAPPPPPQISKKQPPPSSAVASPKPPKQPQPPSSSSSDEEEDSSSGSDSDSPPPAKSPATAMVTALPPPSKAPPPSTSSEADEDEEEDDDEDSGSEPDEPGKPPKPPSPKQVEPQKPQKTPEKKRKAPDSPAGKDHQVKEEPNTKRGIERLWSGADEILLLKGMIEFHTRHGREPSSLNDAAVLLEIIAKELHTEFTPSQLVTKIRHTKRKYTAHRMKEQADGEMPTQKPHEKEVYSLSKNVWGDVYAKRRQAVENGKKIAGRGKAGASPMKRINGNTNDGSVVTIMEVDQVGLSLTADMSLILKEMRRMGAVSEKIEMLKEHLSIVKPDIIAKLAESWKELRGEEVRLWNRQNELVGDVLKAALSGICK